MLTVRRAVPISEAYKHVQNFEEETCMGRPLRKSTAKWVLLIRIVQWRQVFLWLHLPQSALAFSVLRIRDHRHTTLGRTPLDG